MKTIIIAALNKQITSDMYEFAEKNEGPMGREWNGNVAGYVDNYIDISRDINGVELHIVDGISVRNEPADAIIVADENDSNLWMFWSEDVEDDEE